MCVKDYAGLTRLLVDFIQRKMQQANTQKLEVDISGGIDSAVTAAIAVQAAGAENVIGVYSSCQSMPESRVLAQSVADSFGVQLIELQLEPLYQALVQQVRAAFAEKGLRFPAESDDPVVFGSLRSTLRAPAGRFVNRAFGGGLRLGTGNRDEDELVRFYQKGGDGEVDINPIAGLFKSEVWALARYLRVPAQVIAATPTPDLWGNGLGHTDEGELQALTGVALTYTRPDGPLGSIEWVSRENEKHGVITGNNAHLDREELAQQFGYRPAQLAVIEVVRTLERQTRHKAEPPAYLARQELLAEEVVQ